MNGDSRERIEAAGGTLFLLRQPLQIVPGLSTSGEIPRTTDYENTETNLHTIVDDRIVIDRMIDEIALYAAVDRVGTVVVTGCSHSGIVNITRHAGGFFAESAGSSESSPVASIIGGFHLIESGAERITQTVTDLKKEKVGHVYGGHCTGFPAQVALAQEFGTRFTPLRTGDRYHFGPGSDLPIGPR
jgi:7,8-dihydropterin-6-yl-methyl-4-(beta-D-ribofuranosyl)aminobenzene 5'-phosphate synthase